MQQRIALAQAPPDPPVPAATWLKDLADVKVSSDSDLSDFLYVTYLESIESIPLGSHKGIAYFLRTCKDDIPERGSISLTPLERMRGTSEFVKSYEYDRLPTGGYVGPRPDLRYGFGLGALMSQPNTPSGNTEKPPLEETGFFVVCNAIDKSIWVTFDYTPFRQANSEFRVEPLPPTWGLLPEDDSLQIGTMRISLPEWWKKTPLKFTSGDPFSVFPTCSWQLISKPAVAREYLELLPTD
jgi:hypothetical protein